MAGRSGLTYDDPRMGTGSPRFCHECETRIEAFAPDPCLGLIPGVSHACCGHGNPNDAYVALGGAPNEPVYGIDHVVLRRESAVLYFELIKEGEWYPRAAKEISV